MLAFTASHAPVLSRPRVRTASVSVCSLLPARPPPSSPAPSAMPSPAPSATPASPILHTAALTVAAAALLAALHAAPAHAYGLKSGRLEKCRGDIPCISTTSVGNPSKFGPPWSYQPQTDDPDAAWAALKAAVSASKDKGEIVESVDGPDEYYLRAEFPSTLKGVDDVEFRLMKKDALVSYRSASREAIFVYPLQTPLNTDKNRSRLLDIRQALGWEEFSGFNVFGTKL